MRPHIVQRPVNKVEAIATARAVFPAASSMRSGSSVDHLGRDLTLAV
jgi:hypothetical protein